MLNDSEVPRLRDKKAEGRTVLISSNPKPETSTPERIINYDHKRYNFRD